MRLRFLKFVPVSLVALALTFARSLPSLPVPDPFTAGLPSLAFEGCAALAAYAENSEVRPKESLKYDFLWRTIVSDEEIAHYEALKAEKTSKPRLVFHVENAILKTLKDKIFHDGELAVSSTALYKQIFMTLVNDSPLLKSHIIARKADYKGLELMFDTDSLEIRAELQRVYGEAAKLFEKSIGQYPELVEMYKKHHNINASPALWHLAGFGSSSKGRASDEAATAARVARLFYDPSKQTIEIQDFQSTRVQEELAFRLRRVHENRLALTGVLLQLDEAYKATSGRSSDILVKLRTRGSAPPEYVLSPDLIDILKSVKAESKDTYVAYVQAQIKNRFGIVVPAKYIAIDKSDPGSVSLQEFFHSLDTFSPSISQKSEVTDMKLSQAQHGFVAVDHTGQGVRNLFELQVRLARVANDNTIPWNKKVKKAVEEARKGQIKASERFSQIVGHLEKALKNRGLQGDIAFSQDHGTVYSGDDAVFAPDHYLNEAEIFGLMDELATLGTAGHYRLGYIPSHFEGLRLVPAYFEPSSADGARRRIPADLLAGYVDVAHHLEKDLKLALEGPEFQGYFHRRQLRPVIFAVQITARENGNGELTILMGGNVTPEMAQKARQQAQMLVDQFYPGWTLKKLITKEDITPNPAPIDRQLRLFNDGPRRN